MWHGKSKYDMILSLNYIWFIFVNWFPLPHFSVQMLSLLVNGKRIKNGGQAFGFSCNYFYKACPLAKGIHYTGDKWKSSTRVSVFNTFDVWKYVVPFFLISFFFLLCMPRWCSYSNFHVSLKELNLMLVNIIRTITSLFQAPSSRWWWKVVQ